MSTIKGFLLDETTITYDFDKGFFNLYDANTGNHVVFDVDQADEMQRFITDVLTDVGYYE